MQETILRPREKRVSDLERDVREMKQFCRQHSQTTDNRYDDRSQSYRHNDRDRSYRYNDYDQGYPRQGRSRDRTESRRNFNPSPQRSPSDRYPGKQFYNRADQYRRYPSRSPPDNSRGGSPGERYYPQRENSPGGYRSSRGGSALIFPILRDCLQSVCRFFLFYVLVFKIFLCCWRLMYVFIFLVKLMLLSGHLFRLSKMMAMTSSITLPVNSQVQSQ